MTISIGSTYTDLGISSVMTHVGSGGIYRVGDAGIVTNGNLIAGFDDDGVRFSALEFADGSGLGLGRLDAYFVHANGDGSMNVYYQIRDADPLPTTVSNWVVQLDLDGNILGPAREVTDGVFGVTETDMLRHAHDLPDGNILVLGPDILSPGGNQIVDAEGNTIATLDPLGGSGGEADAQHAVDVTVVGDKIFHVYTNTTFGSGGGAWGQVFNMDGSEAVAAFQIGENTTAFGVPSSVQCETLSDGRVVVAWTDGGTTTADESQTSVWFSIYNADGSRDVGPTLVNTVTTDRQDTPVLFATESGFVVGYSVLTFSPPALQEGRLRAYDNDGSLVGEIDDAYNWGTGAALRVDNNTAFVLDGGLVEVVLPGEDGPSGPTGPEGPTRGDDILVGTGAADVISLKAGDDSFRALGGKDRINGDKGNDTLDGGAGNDQLNGNAGRDQLLGQGGRDQLKGGGGRDSLDGGAGRDVLDGGGGNDRLTGRGGNDVFVFSGGQDRVTDFDAPGSDRIDLSGVGAITGFRDLVRNHLDEVGGNAVVMSGGNTMVLVGVGADELEKGDFLF